jgi:dihydroxy-acid dehydratase
MLLIKTIKSVNNKVCNYRHLNTVRYLNTFSKVITQRDEQAASQAMLYGLNLNHEQQKNPFIGIISMWNTGNPCNSHLHSLSSIINASFEKTKINSMMHNTISISDGISMGTDGMKYSLPSRELIADSIESVMKGYHYDGCITVPGCDKNMPGSIMAMARINRPSIMVYGGAIKPNVIGDRRNKVSSGYAKKKIDIVDAFQSYGELVSGNCNKTEQLELISQCCKGYGSCSGMYTANTMASAIEVMGMSLPGSSTAPADSLDKVYECMNIGDYMEQLLLNDIKPSDIITKKSFENAITVVMALGGSTNAVIHLLAMADESGIELNLDDFMHISDNVPYIGDLKPSGKYYMEDLHNIGGIPTVLNELLIHGLIHGDELTITGQTLSSNVEDYLIKYKNYSNNSVPFHEQQIIKFVNQPIKETGHIRILRGNIAPDGAVAKITGKEGNSFTGIAIVFENENDMLDALKLEKIKPGMVIVIRNQGPKGGPGMPEMLKCTSAIVGHGLEKEVAFITDGRFSGGSHGFIIGHVAPESFDGGPIGIIKNGDHIYINSTNNIINLLVSDTEINKRMKEKENKKPNNYSTNKDIIKNYLYTDKSIKVKDYKEEKGYLFKYRKLVGCSSKGCLTT